MSVDYKNIIEKIIERVENAVNDSSIDVITIYKKYKPTLRKPWIRVTLLPSESSNVSQGINSIIEATGLIQIDVFTPQDTLVNFTYADAIITELNSSRIIDVDILSDRTWRGVDVVESSGDWIRTPIFVRFRYYQYGISVND